MAYPFATIGNSHMIQRGRSKDAFFNRVDMEIQTKKKLVEIASNKLMPPKQLPKELQIKSPESFFKRRHFSMA